MSFIRISLLALLVAAAIGVSACTTPETETTVWRPTRTQPTVAPTGDLGRPGEAAVYASFKTMTCDELMAEFNRRSIASLQLDPASTPYLVEISYMNEALLEQQQRPCPGF